MMRGHIRKRASIAALSVASLVAASCTGGGGDESRGASDQPAGALATVEVGLADFTISPATISVPADQPIRFAIMNQGLGPHTFAVVVGDQTFESDLIDPSGQETLDVPALEAGAYEAYCTVAGHKDLGMVATVNVGSDTTSAGVQASVVQ